MVSIPGPSSLISIGEVTSQLKDAWDAFQQVTGSTEHYLAGGAPRDLILGCSPKDWDIWIPDVPEPMAIMLQTSLQRYHGLRLAKGDILLQEVVVLKPEYTILFEDRGYYVRSLGYFQHGPYNFNVIVIRQSMPLDMLLKTFDWDICQVGYGKEGMQGYATVELAYKMQTLRHTGIEFNSTEGIRITLERGYRFEKQFGLKLHPEDILALKSQLPESVEEEEVLLKGYRLYNLQDDKLTGLKGVAWDGPSMEAQHNEGAIPTDNAQRALRHLMSYNNDCMCGINVFKDLPEPNYMLNHRFVAETVVHGIVAEYENGYRAQYGRINQLWEMMATAEDVGKAKSNKPLHHIKLQKRYGIPVIPVTLVQMMEILVEGGARFTEFWNIQKTRSERPFFDFLDTSRIKFLLNMSPILRKAYKEMTNGRTG
ncbi:hypothetical protein LCGC14_1147930 [marine sediment metagenome]|uniref:Poly A polymerase head domain-containing protein n=1 Tax=marine sediment metagenome TaxID=412755 RepID=A0A0F9PEH6_9ZZZZ